MKRLLFLFAALLQAWALAAQCADCRDARQVDLKVEIDNDSDPSNLQTSFVLKNDYSLHNEVLFKLDVSTNGYTFWLHPGDGTPPIQLVNGQTVPHTYPLSAGGADVVYPLGFEVRDGDSSIVYTSPVINFTVKATFTVNSSGYSPPDEVMPVSTNATFQPPVAGAFPAGSPYNSNVVGTADAYIRYAPGHNGKLLKPLIFVDGFDVDATTYTIDGTVVRHGASGWDVFTLGNDAAEPNPYDPDPPTYRYYPTAFETFLQAGYDIVFLDFSDGTDYIQKNGLLLVKLIEEINNRKALHAAEGETVCDNAIVGASMGGQIAKWALSYMEEQGIPHQTHTYVSFDSPQRGANIPLGIQSAAFLLNRAGFDSNDLWGRSNSPAAREMLMYSLAGCVESGSVSIELEEVELCIGSFIPQPLNIEYGNSIALRQSFQSEMASLGYPHQTRNVAISCGSRAGNGLEFNEGQTFLWARRSENPPNISCGLEGDVLWADIAALNGNSMTINKYLSFSGGTGSWGCCTANFPGDPATIFRGAIPIEYVQWAFSSVDPPRKSLMMRTFAEQNFPSLDNAPGCKRGDLFSFEKLLRTYGAEVPINLGYTTFMPTLSTLDIQWPMDNEHLTMSFTESDLVDFNLTPFDAVWASPDVNLRHVELNADMTNWTLQQLALGLAQAGGGSLNLTAGQTYNYGKRKNRVPDVTINNGGLLAVNLDGHINYMTPSDPLADLPHFEVYTGGGCSNGKTILIEHGGTVQIGDPGSGKTGVFHALRESVVHVKSGGTLRINNASSLIIYEGASLILDPGAIVRLESSGAKIRIEGRLIVNGDIDFAGTGY
ncbi:MAG TPA: hypothetical protein PKH43_06100, partial [Saprospiraceae bacterium]|nr:hypothetical protein [Saprospiraceae bacterium]